MKSIKSTRISKFHLSLLFIFQLNFDCYLTSAFFLVEIIKSAAEAAIRIAKTFTQELSAVGTVESVASEFRVA